MARPLRVEYEGAIYHVTSRGNERKDIFKSEYDKEKFLSYVERAWERFGIVIHAYCLMSNHYHFILETPHANLSKCMQYINSSYTTYFNVKRKRFGHLFQGRYKSILIEKDAYLQVLSRYIHLNPVNAGLEKKLGVYPWSSFSYYVDRKKAPVFLSISDVLEYFGGSKYRYRKYMEDGLSNKMDNPLSKLNQWNILGSDVFIDKIKKKYLVVNKEDRDLPKLRDSSKLYVRIVSELKKLNTVSAKDQQKLLMYFLRKYTDFSLREIANCVDGKKLSVSGVSVSISRLEKKRSFDKKLDCLIRRVEEKLSNV